MRAYRSRRRSRCGSFHSSSLDLQRPFFWSEEAGVKFHFSGSGHFSATRAGDCRKRRNHRTLNVPCSRSSSNVRAVREVGRGSDLWSLHCSRGKMQPDSEVKSAFMRRKTNTDVHIQNQPQLHICRTTLDDRDNKEIIRTDILAGLMVQWLTPFSDEFKLTWLFN